MWIGWLGVHFLLGGGGSAKQKRFVGWRALSKKKESFFCAAGNRGTEPQVRRIGRRDRIARTSPTGRDRRGDGLGRSQACCRRAGRRRTPGGGASGVRGAVGAPRSAAQRRLITARWGVAFCAAASGGRCPGPACARTPKTRCAPACCVG